MRRSTDEHRRLASEFRIHARAGCAERTRLVTRLAVLLDPLFFLLTWACAASIVAITVLLVHQLYVHSAPSRHTLGWNFLIGQNWDPVAGDFGALPFIFGTIVTSIVALLIAVPLGVGTAIFLAEMAPPRISRFLTFVVDLLAAVPSVIYGLLGHLPAGPVLDHGRRAAPAEGARLPADLQRPDLRREPVHRLHRAGHHDSAVHRLHLAGGAAGRPAGPAGGGPGRGRHALGDRLAGRRAVCPAGHRRLGVPGAGARAGRDDGRDDGDRQHPADRRRSLRRAIRSRP